MRNLPLAFGLALTSAAHAQVTDLISQAVSGGSANGFSQSCDISRDGRFIVFESTATNLTSSSDFNGQQDAFITDLATGTTEFVSVSAVHGAIGNGPSGQPSVSGDGRYVVFVSDAGDLVPGDSNGRRDVFRRDRWSGTTELVSVDANGVQATRHCGSPIVSADGRYVAFETYDTLNASFPPTTYNQLFLKDMVTGELHHVSKDGNGAPGDRESYPCDLSADGSTLVFTSFATNLVASDTNGFYDVFVYDRVQDHVELVSQGIGGAPANSMSSNAAVSADGRTIVFQSRATNIHPQAPESTRKVFRLDRPTGALELVATDASGSPVGRDHRIAAVSDDASRVLLSTYESFSHLDRSSGEDLYLAIDGTPGLTLMSVGQNGSTGMTGYARSGCINGSGEVVAFYSDRAHLVPGDSNGAFDVFARKACRAEVGTYGTGQPGTNGTPSLTFEHLPLRSVLPRLEIESTSPLPNAITIVMYGLSPDNQPAPWGTNLAVLQRSLRGYVAPGTNLLPIPLETSQVPCGLTLYFQAIVQDPGAPNGLSSSNGAWMTVGY